MNTRESLYSKLIVEARPVNIREQDVEDTEQRLIDVLNEAYARGIIVTEALMKLLSYIQEYLERVRRHLATTNYSQRNLWREHNLFCVGLKDVFPEK